MRLRLVRQRDFQHAQAGFGGEHLLRIGFDALAITGTVTFTTGTHFNDWRNSTIDASRGVRFTGGTGFVSPPIASFQGRASASGIEIEGTHDYAGGGTWSAVQQQPYPPSSAITAERLRRPWPAARFP
jgi:hypothetical protein